MSSSQPARAPNSSDDRRRRRYPRFCAEFPVTVLLLSGSRYQTLEGHCKDLSEAGIGLLLAFELGVKEVVSLKLRLPNTTEEWQVSAVLRYRRGYHYGFEFLSLTESRRQSLRDYIQQLQRAD